MGYKEVVSEKEITLFLLLPRWGSQQMSLDQASRYDEWKCHQKLWKWVHEPTNFLDHLLAPHEHLMKRTHTDKTNRLRRLQAHKHIIRSNKDDDCQKQ